MKNFNRKNEKGRSMIEMLGVLAIIGVLSVGGIAGYSKAMTKYRINKTIEQLTLIVGNFRAFYGRQKDVGDFYCFLCGSIGDKIVQKAKLIPDEMMVLDDNGNLRGGIHAFGGDFTIEIDNGNNELYIPFYNITEEVCIELLVQDWSVANIHKIGVYGFDVGSQILNTPIDLADAIQACSLLREDPAYSDVDFYFKVK